MKKIGIALVLMVVSACAWALDIKYISIVNPVIAGLKTDTTLSLLKGHAAIHISSGNKELDIQFAEEIQEAYPNLASGADTVAHEDLYQMTVKVYREDDAVVVHTTVSNFEQKKIVERTAKAKNVQAAVLETLQYKTAIIAKNEFDEYLDSAFADAGEVAEDVHLPPPKPKKPP